MVALVAWMLVVLAANGWSVRAALRAEKGMSEAEIWGADANGYYGTETLKDSDIGLVPISLNPTGQGSVWEIKVGLCILDQELRNKDPSGVPMFRFLVQKSGCNGNAKPGTIGYSKTVRLGELRAYLERTELDWARRFGNADTKSAVWRPAGFVFHEARVGSTLVSNMLQSLPNSTSYSESSPPMDFISRGLNLPREDRIQAFRVVVRAMGRVPYLNYLFFKFQSGAVAHMDFVVDAFPDTPWVFLKREPVEVMASLLGTFSNAVRTGAEVGKTTQGAGTPCTRTIRAPPEDMAAALGASSQDELRNGGTEAFCAAHLGYLEYRATESLKAAAKRAMAGKGAGVGAAVDYKELPSAVPRIIREMFRVPVDKAAEATMMEVATVYSKGTNKRAKKTSAHEDGTFKSDSEAKVRTAPPQLAEAAEKYILPRRKALEQFTVDAAINLVKTAAGSAALPAVPTVEELQAAKESGDEKHSELSKSGNGPESATDSSKKGFSLVSKGLNDGKEAIELVPPQANTADAGLSEYPKLFSLPEMLDAWSVDEPRVPSDYGKYASLRVFDFTSSEEVELAKSYREAEVPFVARGVPNLLRANREWTDEYLERNLPGARPTEISPTNHFMFYHKGGSRQSGATAQYPIQTHSARKTFREWLDHARQIDEEVLSGKATNRETEHWYFRASSRHASPTKGIRGENSFITKSLTIYDRSKPDNGDEEDVAKSDFFILDAAAQRGIHCRFGQAGIVAESHYDGGRNFISMVRGRKRYILSPPSECPNYNLLFTGASARHSKTDWGDPSDYKQTLAKAKALEVIIEPGDSLYVPSLWFHLPISLDTNIQCNTRSGSPPEGSKDIAECGFGVRVTETDKQTRTPKTMAPPPGAPTPAPKPAVS
ncbi:hypothetical protein FNF29_04695 [Cafeteria roenbergensis]|uniref:JmjC domain-containing protein n=2 Tax=Cafeteria roenbergensis TaxID=33653 RepID=A0A5A8D3A7_CAFRO|nr:hypothetical protein FNF29_04695 [Cafeteria roenbergensis]KAA0159274.1 hypothetical protein FNF28_05909 [Cafeteria roenbergensis]KAA0159451.1 hypothetical protein FNF31_04817 [Cafeteria roenbergensis]|eukprot:KAA0151220.1 hypothetical protein FNF29_04695 [Cafeteria roenbergensis]